MEDPYSRKFKHYMLYCDQKNIDIKDSFKVYSDKTFSFFLDFVRYKVYDVEENEYGIKLLKHFIIFIFNIDNTITRTNFFYNFILFFTKYHTFLKDKKYNNFIKIYIEKIEEVYKKVLNKERKSILRSIINIYKLYY